MKTLHYDAVNGQKIMNKLRYFVEDQIFGVCANMGDMLKIPASSIRLYFIYATFMTFGSPIILYLIMAFWMQVRQHWRRHHSPTVWEL